RNVKNKTPHTWAQTILRLLNSYAEVSPSGTGIHILVKAKKPGERCRHGKVEMYDHARFATMTGRVMDSWGTGKIESRQQELEQLYHTYIAISQTGTDRAVPSVPMPEDKLAALLKLPAAQALYQGTYDGKYPSQSEADLAFANLAVRAGWTEGETRTLIETAREHAGAEPKHDGYYRLTYQRARGDLAPVE